MFTTEEKYKLIYRKFDDLKHCGKPLCPLCGSTYKCGKKAQSLDSHIERNHKEIYSEYKKLIEDFNKRRDSDFVECPICNKRMKQLNRHILMVHNIKTNDDYKKMFPEYPISTSNATIHYEECVCEICGKSFATKSGLGSHKKVVHNIKLEKCVVENNIEFKFECKICGKKTNNIKDHIVSCHKIDWVDYCNKFNEDVTKKAYFTDSHRKRLSTQKSEFYMSDRGLKLKSIQSKMYSGDNNPSKRQDVRDKLSKAQSKYTLNDSSGFSDTSYGIKFRCSEIGLFKFCRSFEEFLIAYTCYINNIKFEYEPCVLNLDLDNKSSYIPDFMIGDVYYEIKSDLRKYDVNKYEQINESINRLYNKRLIVCDYKQFCLLNNVDIIDKCIIFDRIKELFNEDKILISYYNPYKQNSRILGKITKNYKNDRRINYNNNNKEILKYEN